MMNSVSNEIAIAYRSDSTVLISGPTGCGKTRLAQQIHTAGRRGLRPFVTVNLASLHEGTLESELFGHERGAFTGARDKRIGRIAAAQGGTVFLDEIGELSPRLQARLLEFLQFKTLTPLGSNRPVQLDVRVIAATNRDLAQEVRGGRFREDLFHRLRVLCVRMPGLAERREEFDRIVHECLAEVCAATGRTILKMSAGVAERLETHAWPGNVRELRNVLEYAVLSAEGPEITVADLPSWFGMDHGSLLRSSETAAEGGFGTLEVPLGQNFAATLASFEKEYLSRAMQRHRGRISKTASSIGISKTTLIRRLKAYGLASSHAK